MSWLLANSISAAVLSGIVLLIARWWKPAPAVMHGLWLVVVLKLVTPPLFEIPLDVSWLPDTTNAAPSRPAAEALPRLLPDTAPEPTASAPSPELAAVPQVTPEPLAGTDIGSANEPAPRTEAHGAVDGGAAAFPWLWLWLGSSGLLLLATSWRTVQIHRQKRAFGPVPMPLRLEVRELAERIGVAVPELCDDPRTAAPYVWTIGRTRLILPVQLLQQCTKKGREAVIAHELAHLHRRDHWVARAELVLLTLLWWHPLFWFARSRMRLWAELACDAIAVTTVPDASLDYATLLVDAAAQPAPTRPGVAVLASRPAARAAFERRLKMILNDNLPRRASRAWCVPFAALTLGLFAAPVAAQEQEPEPVRVEIRVNGKTVKNLTPAQREKLLEVLLDDKAPEKAKKQRKERRRIRIRKPDSLPEEPREQEPRRTKKNKKKLDPGFGGSIRIEGLPESGDFADALKQGLAEARRELKNDKDLAELGITDEVLDMLDDLAEGKGIESSLDGVIRAAMKGAGDLVIKELEDDEDLRKLGIDKGILKMVTGLLDNEANQKMIGEFARTALGAALDEAKQEIRADKDLRKLGLTKDVESLIDSIVSGQGDFEGDLDKIIQKAMEAAMAEVEHETANEKKSDRKIRIQRGKKKDRRRETIR